MFKKYIARPYEIQFCVVFITTWDHFLDKHINHPKYEIVFHDVDLTSTYMILSKSCFYRVGCSILWMVLLNIFGTIGTSKLFWHHFAGCKPPRLDDVMTLFYFTLRHFAWSISNCSVSNLFYFMDHMLRPLANGVLVRDCRGIHSTAIIASSEKITFNFSLTLDQTMV